jgi:hypothetical protein
LVTKFLKDLIGRLKNMLNVLIHYRLTMTGRFTTTYALLTVLFKIIKYNSMKNHDESYHARREHKFLACSTQLLLHGASVCLLLAY